MALLRPKTLQLANLQLLNKFDIVYNLIVALYSKKEISNEVIRILTIFAREKVNADNA